MEITNYSDIKLEDMPTTVYTAICSFTSEDIDNKSYTINGAWRENIIDGLRNNKYVETSFININNELLFIYHGNNPNKIFTTKKEAIDWSEKDLGYIK